MEQNNVGLMRIAGIAESEVAWSNIYAYYMDPRNEPKYAFAFTTALLELCGLNRSEVLPDDSYCVNTEVATPKQSRIDILIEGAASIIIENKINHILDNPLDEYWDYAANPAVLVVLTISRLTEQELRSFCFNLHNQKEDADRIRCVNITHYDLMTQTKTILGKEFASPILKELENIIIEKTVIMPESLYIKNNEERLEINRIYEQESKRRQKIANECMELKAFDSSGFTPIIKFKSCPNNNYLHFRYRGQDDLVIGVMCAYLWDWERYERDSKLRIRKSGPELKQTPVITLFVQVHGNLYREMKREDLIAENGYEIRGKFCHVIDFDIDMSKMPDKLYRSGELAAFLSKILRDRDNCHILREADRIYKKYILRQDTTA